MLHADRTGSSQASRVLEQLCRKYWLPVYGFVRRQGHSPEDAQDSTREFFSRMLSKQVFAKADPLKGRFPSYLLGALKRFLADEWDKVRAQKRGGDQEILSLNSQETEARYLEEPTTNQTPEKVFDRRWAMRLLDLALDRLESEFITAGKTREFNLFKPFLTGENFPGAYQEVAGQLNASAGAVAVAVHRLRQRFQDLIRTEIAQTVTGPEEAEEELRSLFG